MNCYSFEKMTIKELHQQLQKLGVTSENYYLHGRFGSTNDNEKIALTIHRGKYFI